MSSQATISEAELEHPIHGLWIPCFIGGGEAVFILVMETGRENSTGVILKGFRVIHTLYTVSWTLQSLQTQCYD